MSNKKDYLTTATNKKAWDLWNEYQRTNGNIDSILKAYKTKPSIEKIEAENKIKREMMENNGHNYKVLGHNTFNYSCGYVIDFVNTQLLVVHTHCNTYKVLFNGVYMK